MISIGSNDGQVVVLATDSDAFLTIGNTPVFWILISQQNVFELKVVTIRRAQIDINRLTTYLVHASVSET